MTFALSIVTTILLGLLLTPALADVNFNGGYYNNWSSGGQTVNEGFLADETQTRQIPIDGGYQILTIYSRQRVASIQQESTQGSWKIIGNFDKGAVATKVLLEGICYVSKVNRMEMPNFGELPRLVDESMSLQGQRQPAKEVTFIIKRRIHDLRSYGQDIFAMCRGLPTYVAYKVNGPQYQYNQGSCLTIDILQLLDLQYCHQPEQTMMQGRETN